MFEDDGIDDFTTLGQLRRKGGKFRNGRRTPETVYASFDDNLDDRSTNYPVTLFTDTELAKFFVEAANEKLERMRRPADPEAWLADQLAQLPTASDTMSGCRIVFWGPEEEAFAEVQKIAQEYGEMCAARATEGLGEI